MLGSLVVRRSSTAGSKANLRRLDRRLAPNPGILHRAFLLFRFYTLNTSTSNRIQQY
jgi:hypothetical protein